MAEGKPLATYPVHLGLGAKAISQPEFNGMMDWYEAYGARTNDDGAEGRLVALNTFTEPWTMWEMHPEGDEVVVCLSGSLVLIQELADGTAAHIELGESKYAINPAGVWHTADATEPANVLFITAGLGTQHRPR